MEPFNTYHAGAIFGVAMCCLLSTIGVFGNVNIVVATYRKKRLRSTCNILIAINAFADTLHQSGHLIFGFYYAMGSPFTTLHNVFFLYIPSTIGTYLGPSVMVVIGIDRLFCVLWPMTYNMLNRPIYFCALLIFPIVYVTMIMYYCYLNTVANADSVVLCLFTQVNMGSSSQIWGYMQLIFCLTTVLCYTVIWTFLIKRNRGSVQKTVKPLSFVTLSEVTGWFIALLVMYAFGGRGMTEPEYGFAVLMNGGWIVSFGVTSNYFAYFLLNKEYRNAFKEQLSMLCCDRIQKLDPRRTQISVMYGGRVSSNSTKFVSRNTM